MVASPAKIGKYEVIAEIGRGGMGAVYRARDPVLDRIVAVKTMAVDVLSDRDMRDRFLREARSAARLQHSNIVTVHDFGEVSGAPFIVMEYLEGDNLAEAVDRALLPDLASRLGVVIHLCNGLAYAHQHGVIHRDMKPTNVFLLSDGGVKIVDFGLAWLDDTTFATRSGQLLGTPSFMAPEQFLGEEIDRRVDVWAVGVILYELICGRRPFDAATVPSLIYQVVHAPPLPLEARLFPLPARLHAVIELALAKERGQRFPDLEAMGKALRNVRDELPTVVRLRAEALPIGIALGPSPAAATLIVPPPSRSPEPPHRAVSTPASTLVEHTPSPSFNALLEDGSFGEERRLQLFVLSSDDALLADGGTDGSIRLWGVATRTKLATFRNRVHLRTGHGSLATALAFSGDGTLLVSGHLDGAVYLWEAASGLEFDARMGHEGAVGGVAILPDGRAVVSGGADATIKFWDLAAVRAGDARRTMRRQPDAITCLTLGRKGQVVVTGHVNKSIRVHDANDQRLVATLHGHKAPVSALAASPSGELVASGARDGAVRVHNLQTREQLGFHQEHGRCVVALAFFPDEQRLASVAMDNTVLIYDIAEPGLPYSFAGDQEESFAGVCVTRDGRRLICATSEGRFRVWLV